MNSRMKLDEGWTTLFLVWAMIFVAAWAILDSNLIDGLGVVPLAATIAVFAGLPLAKSRFSSGTAHLFAIIYGLFVVLYLVGDLLPAEMAWRERIFDLLVRQVEWVRDAVEGGRNRDGLIFVIQTSFVYWLLGYTAAWYTFRHPRVWRVVVPAGLVLLSVVYYYQGPNELGIFLGLYALLALIFVARTYLVDQERIWRSNGVRYESAIWYSFLRAAFLAALIALMASWMMPTFSASATVGDAFSGARGPWKDFQDTWTRLFSSLRSYATTASDPYRDQLVLGGPRTVGNSPIMDVGVAERLPFVYWQAIVYDSYEDGGWEISPNTNALLYGPENGPLSVPFTQARRVVTQTVVNYLPNSSFIYAAPEVIGVNREAFVDATFDAGGNVLVTALRSRYVLRLNEEYLVASSISTADATQLRQASTAYPEWVKTRYLQVPPDVTRETIDLAAGLTGPYTTAFDKAMAIRDYLRSNITYNDQIPAPPNGIDPVHYTLFVSKEGYCNYYASAMALMLRSQGVPTRVVSGYAQGEYDEDTKSYRVRASNAHTWVEVYFPGFGWIQFEPTAALPTYDRLEGEGGNPGDAFGTEDAFESGRGEFGRDSQLGLEFLDEGPDEFASSDGSLAGTGVASGPFWERVSVWQVVAAIMAVVAAGLAILAANEINKRVERDVERSYSRLSSWARWLGLLFRPSHTPNERAEMMASAVPDGSQPINNLTRFFVQRQFSREPWPADPRAEWKALRPLLLRTGLSQRWQQLRAWRPRRRR